MDDAEIKEDELVMIEKIDAVNLTGTNGDTRSENQKLSRRGNDSDDGIEDVLSLRQAPEPVPTPASVKSTGTRAKPKPMRHQHSEKLSTIRPLCSAMITMSFPRGDPRSRSPEARVAVLDELAASRKERTWLEDEVYELDDAKKLFPDMHFLGFLQLWASRISNSRRVSGSTRAGLCLAATTSKMHRVIWAVSGHTYRRN